VSLSFRLAMRGGPIATLVYARLCAGLVLSLHAEHFLNDLNFLIKLLVFLLFMYRVLPALERQRRLETSHA
jgi:hypothetical protein